MRSGRAPWGDPALPEPVRGPLLAVAVAAAAVLGALAGYVAGAGGVTGLDRLLLGGSDGWRAAEVYHRTDPPILVAVAVGHVGDPLVVAGLAAAAAALAMAIGRARLAVLAVAAPAATGLATTALKPVVGRVRDGFLAFPSGHTAAATSVALVAGLVLAARFGPRLPLVLGTAVAAGAAMAWAQVVLGIHDPTDTIGGACTGLAVVPATAALIDLLARAPP